MKYSGVFGRQVCNQMILTTSMHMQHQLPWVHNLHVKEKSTLKCFSIEPLMHSRVRVQISVHRSRTISWLNKESACTTGVGLEFWYICMEYVITHVSNYICTLLRIIAGDVVEARAMQDFFKEHTTSGCLVFSSTKVKFSQFRESYQPPSHNLEFSLHKYRFVL